MKNIAVLSVLVIMFPIFSYTQTDKNYGLLVGTQVGFVYGQSIELVYPEETFAELYSELKYDMKPVFYWGLNISYDKIDIYSSPGFFYSISFNIGVASDSGIHENRDWQSIENANLTDFSTHTNRTSSFFWLDADIGATLPLDPFLIRLFLNTSWMFFAFTGRDGYGIYARATDCFCSGPHNPWFCDSEQKTFYPIDEEYFEYFYNGNVIRYQQHWLLASFGFSINTKKFFPLSLEFSFKISPFTYCAAKDEHLTNNKTFWDYTVFGFFIEPRFLTSFSSNNLIYTLDIGYRYIGRTRGPAFIDRGNTGFIESAGQGGAELSVLDVCFLITYRY